MPGAATTAIKAAQELFEFGMKKGGSNVLEKIVDASSGVIGAAGKVLGNVGKGIGKGVVAGGITAAQDAATIADKAFEQVLVKGAKNGLLNEPVENIGKGVVKNLSEGQIIPVKLKKNVALGAIGLMVAGGVGAGAIHGVSQPHKIEDPDVMQAMIPGTLSEMTSPKPKPIDYHGASGALVFALHKLR